MSAPPPGYIMTSAISVHDLSHHYPGERHAVLSGLTLEVPAGHIAAVLGRSGSGKSTLLNLLGGMEAIQQGDIAVAGIALRGLDEASRTRFRRTRLGFIFQSYNLVPVLDVARNLHLPLALNGGRSNAPALRLLHALGLEGFESRYPETLSGGEQQRVAIARALVHEPAVVLADEPTGSLDLDTARVVLELLGRLVRERGITLVMATHSREAAALADSVYELRGGRLYPVD